MLYLIGGAPRCGKTKLAKKISRKLSIPVFSTDELRLYVRDRTPRDEVDGKFPFEAMFDGDQVDRCFERYAPKDFLMADKREARTLFKAVRSFLEDKIRKKDDYIIEGVHLLPRYVGKILLPKKEFRAVYLVKTDEGSILDGLKRNNDKKDWILGHIHKKRTLDRAAAMVGVYGRYFTKEAKKFGFRLINTEDCFYHKIDEAGSYLMD